jgi:hypothetical protein
MSKHLLLMAASADDSWRVLLEKMLAPLIRQDRIRTWTPDKIPPGSNRKQALAEAFNQAVAVVPLVTANFLDLDLSGLGQVG